MGVYPTITYEVFGLEKQGPDGQGSGRAVAILVRKIETAETITWQYFEGVKTTEIRHDCFCCSCTWPHGGWGLPTRDPHCRNHGWVGRRPCEEHKMNGTAYGPEDVGDVPMDWGGATSIMPDSVQKERASRGTK
jgi:hypothetical protein